MSRIGKHPVVVPEGVTVQVDSQKVTAKGKLGERVITLVDDIAAELRDNEVWITPRNESKRARMMWGTSRSLVDSLIKGVSEGFTVNLVVVGVGYRATVEGDKLNLQLGYSRDIEVPIPDGISIKCARPTQISVTGMDRQKVGQVAANIRAFRKPEPYKGKGIKYEDEVVRRKEGKKK
jgi:large subunit ribosomal protein L6